MQRFSFQLSIGGKNIMSNKEKVLGLQDQSNTDEKKDHEKIPNGEINESDRVPKIETQLDFKEQIDSDKTSSDNLDSPNMEQNPDKKPKGITKEVKERYIKQYKHVPEKEIKKYLSFFKEADVDKFGYLTIQRFAAAIRRRGARLSDSTIANMFIDINENRDGEITLDEYMKEMTKRNPRSITDDEMKLIFKRFDSNNDGYLTERDLEQTLDELHIKRTDLLIQSLLRNADKNHDGKISFEEFVAACRKDKYPRV